MGLTGARRVTAPTATAVVAKVEAFYRGTTHGRAAFTQTVTNQTFGRTDTARGTLFLARPGKMRWQYLGKPHHGKASVAKDFISDGKTLYLLDHENKQVMKKTLADNLLPSAIAFLDGKGSLTRDFTATLVAGSGDLVLDLAPKTPSTQYRTLRLVVDPADFHVKATVLTDAAGNTNQFTFGALDQTSSTPDKLFQVNPKSRALRAYRLITP